MIHTTEDFASINLDTENPTLEPAAKSIRNTIRNEHNIPESYHITIHGIEAWIPENRLTIHVHIEDENNNNVTEEYDEAKHYHSIDNMNPLSDNELETLKELHNNTS
jgi:hypothetical protein